MGQAAQNLVILKGDTKALQKFKNLAYKNDSEAFSFDKLIPFPDYYLDADEEKEAFSYLCYGNRWGAGFGVLARETENTLMYFFNSKTTTANLEFVAKKFYDLELIHIGITISGNTLIWDYYNYNNGAFARKYRLTDEKFDFKIVSDLYSYEYIAELYIKYKSLIESKIFIEQRGWEVEFVKNNSCAKDFFEIFHRFTYLREKKELYDGILNDVKNLNKQDLKWAKEIAYPFRTANLYYQLTFINSNYINDEKEKYFDEIISGINLDEINISELLGVAKYCFVILDSKTFFNKIIKQMYVRLSNDIIELKNQHHESKKRLVDYPGLVKHYSPDLKITREIVCLNKHNEFDKEQRSLDNEIKELLNLNSDYDNKFHENIYYFYKKKKYHSRKIFFLDPEDRLKLINYLTEVIDYRNQCIDSIDRLEKFKKKENRNIIFPTNYAMDCNLSSNELVKVIREYDLPDIFPQFKEDDSDDLPF